MVKPAIELQCSPHQKNKTNIMKRITLTDETGRWFDSEAAEEFSENTWHDGSNLISYATGSSTEHQNLFRTVGGKWILNSWSQYQGRAETYEEISNEDAAIWLSKNNHEPHEACKKEFEDLEIK